MAISREFTVPSRRYGLQSGTPDLDTLKLATSVPDARDFLYYDIKINKADILTAFPSLKQEDLTKEFGIKFISGGLPLVFDTNSSSYIFNSKALVQPEKVLENNNIGLSMNRFGLANNIEDDGVSYYVKSDSTSKNRCILLGNQASFNMRVSLTSLGVSEYTKGRTNGEQPTEEELEAPNTTTGDYNKVKKTATRKQDFILGDSVVFNFLTIPGAWGWVIEKASADVKASCSIITMPVIFDTNNKPIVSFGNVLIRINRG